MWCHSGDGAESLLEAHSCGAVKLSCRVMLLGPPLSGKSSQCQALATRLGLPHIQVGALLQARAAAGDEALQTILQASVPACMSTFWLCGQLGTSACMLILFACLVPIGLESIHCTNEFCKHWQQKEMRRLTHIPKVQCRARPMSAALSPHQHTDCQAECVCTAKVTHRGNSHTTRAVQGKLHTNRLCMWSRILVCIGMCPA